MDCVWDLAKGRANLKKHGVDFVDAVVALEDPLAVTILDPAAENEDRYISLGEDAFGRLLVTVFTLRGECIRIISSRKATRRERRRYENEA